MYIWLLSEWVMGRHKQQSLLLYNLQSSTGLERTLKDLPNPGIEPRSPSLQADSLPAEPQGKPKNTGVGSLSLLQWIFLTQELNQGLLHCRWIVYQLSYQGSPQEEEWDLESWILPNKILLQINTHIQTPQHLRSTGKWGRKENENTPLPCFEPAHPTS